MTDRSSAGGAPPARLPGSVGLWVFITSDLLLFALYFALFAHDLAAAPNLFARDQVALDPGIGLINTLVLLTGSWAVVMGTRVTRDPGRSSLWLAGAAVTGLVFLFFKAVEYTHIVGAGQSLTASVFFTWYFFLTGYHALHVVAGILLLWLVAARRRRGTRVAGEMVEVAGCYWHLVDVLWIGIFTILYLL